MTNPQLLDYVRQQISLGVSADAIKAVLTAQGWNVQDVAEAFATIEKEQSSTPAQPAPVVNAQATATPSDQKHTATLGRRLGNELLDFIFLYIAQLAVSALLQLSGFAMILQIALGWAMFLVYYIVFETLWQRTPAKWITKTKVVSLDGTKPEMIRIVGRTLCRLIPFDAFSFLFGKYPYGWHDRFSKTMVIPAECTAAEAATIDPKNKGKSSVGVIILVIFLLAIPVVGIMASIVLTSLGTARSHGQAATAKVELLSARTQLELYAVTHNDLYPDTLGVASPGIDETKYTYSVSADKKSYLLCPQGNPSIAECLRSIDIPSAEGSTSTP